jgi:hypothetical protein
MGGSKKYNVLCFGAIIHYSVTLANQITDYKRARIGQEISWEVLF